jgi:hypothetical protein
MGPMSPSAFPTALHRTSQDVTSQCDRCNTVVVHDVMTVIAYDAVTLVVSICCNRYIRKLKPLPGRGNSVFLAELQPSGERFVLKKLEKDTGLYPASSSAQLERGEFLFASRTRTFRIL